MPLGRKVDQADAETACVSQRSIRGIAQAVTKRSSHHNNLANGRGEDFVKTRKLALVAITVHQ